MTVPLPAGAAEGCDFSNPAAASAADVHNSPTSNEPSSRGGAVAIFVAAAIARRVRLVSSGPISCSGGRRPARRAPSRLIHSSASRRSASAAANPRLASSFAVASRNARRSRRSTTHPPPDTVTRRVSATAGPGATPAMGPPNAASCVFVASLKSASRLKASPGPRTVSTSSPPSGSGTSATAPPETSTPASAPHPYEPASSWPSSTAVTARVREMARSVSGGNGERSQWRASDSGLAARLTSATSFSTKTRGCFASARCASSARSSTSRSATAARTVRKVRVPSLAVAIVCTLESPHKLRFFSGACGASSASIPSSSNARRMCFVMGVCSAILYSSSPPAAISLWSAISTTVGTVVMPESASPLLVLGATPA